MFVLKTQLFPCDIAAILKWGRGWWWRWGSLINITIKQCCDLLCMWSRSRVSSPGYGGGGGGLTVIEPAAWSTVCALSRNQNKKQDGGTVFMWGPHLPPAPHPGTFFITIQSLSVYTITGAEWTPAEGSPWEALVAPPRLPHHPSLRLSVHRPPSTSNPTQTHTNTPLSSRDWIPRRGCYFSPLLISCRYGGLLRLDLSAIGAPLTHDRLSAHGPRQRLQICSSFGEEFQ